MLRQDSTQYESIYQLPWQLKAENSPVDAVLLSEKAGLFLGQKYENIFYITVIYTENGNRTCYPNVFKKCLFPKKGQIVYIDCLFFIQ